MTREDIFRMATEAGFLTNSLKRYLISPYSFEDQDLYEELERFAKLVRNDYSNKHAQLWLKRIDDAVKAEREACAKVIEAEQGMNPDWQKHLAYKIRARGAKE